MRRWERYSDFLDSGCWHVHTAYTDGSASVLEMCKRASDKGYPLIAIAEHTRREMDYRWESLREEVEKAKELLPDMRILLGCEASVMDRGGSIGVPDEVVRDCDIVYFSYHSFPFVPMQTDVLGSYLDSVLNVLSRNDVDVWGHPTSMLIRRGFELSEGELERIGKALKASGVLVERSMRYPMQKGFSDMLDRHGVPSVRGFDAHKTVDIM